MTRRLSTRLVRLEEATAALPDDEPMCVHHGGACGMGARPYDELFLHVHEARRKTGKPVPPLDVHREMTAAERAQDAREVAVLLAELKAENARLEAELREERYG